MHMSMPAPKQRPYVPLLRLGDAVPAVALVDERGRPFDLAATRRTTVLSFLYTRCSDERMCPLVAAKFARLQQLLRGTPIRLVTITLDPGYDTPPVLQRYGAAFGADPARWSLVTGAPAAVDELAARLGVAVERPHPGTIVHTEAAIVLDEQGSVARVVDGATWLPEDLAAEARSVAALPQSPLLRLRLWLSTSASALCGGRGATPVTVGAALAVLLVLVLALGVTFARAFRRPAPTR